MNFYRHSTAVALVLAISGGMVAISDPANAQARNQNNQTQANSQTAEQCIAQLREIEQNMEQAKLSQEERQQFDRMRQEVRQLSEEGNVERCMIVVAEMDRYVEGDEKERAAIIVQREQAEVTVRQPQPQVQVRQPEPQITVRQAQPEVTVTQGQPQITVRQAKPEVTVRVPEPEVIIRQGEPQVTVSQAEPQVQVQQPEPKVQVQQRRPEVDVQMANPQVNVQQARPQVEFDRPEPRVIVQKQQPEVHVEQQRAAVTVERAEPQVRFEQQEPKVNVQQQRAQVNVEQQQPEVRVQQQQPEVRVEQQQAAVSVEQQRQQQAQREVRQQQSDDRTLNLAANERRTAIQETNPILSMRADELIGTDVYGARGEQVGDIEHVLLGENNQVYAVVSVGGFLGIGDHDVALPIDRFTQQGDRFVLSSETEESLKDMPDYDEGAAGYRVVERDRRAVDYMR